MTPHRTASLPPRQSTRRHQYCVSRLLVIPLLFVAVTVASTTWANGHDPWPPAPEYDLHQKEIPIEDPDKAEHYQKHIEYSLTFEEHDDPVFLARAYTSGKSAYTRLGFSEKSFELVWLDHGTLLHASWETSSQGTGDYIMDSHILLYKKQNAWHEMFRDSHFGYASSNAGSGNSETLEFLFEPASGMLVVLSTRGSSEVWHGEAHPLGKQTAIGTGEPNKGIPRYVKSYRFVREWP